jgi:K+-sensing histidine kinase KdpD
MSDGPLPPTAPWPKLMSLAVHELRTPVTVVAGYISMLLKDRAGPLSDQQRRLLEEASKSTARLSAVISEMSDLAKIESGEALRGLKRTTIDLGALLETTVGALPPLPDREIAVLFENDAAGATVQGDPVRLASAFSAVLAALRRELITSTELHVRLTRGTMDGGRVLRVDIANGDQMARLRQTGERELGSFDELRGGCGVSLPIARRIFDAHDGHLWSPPVESKAGAVVVLPQV